MRSPTTPNSNGSFSRDGTAMLMVRLSRTRRPVASRPLMTTWALSGPRVRTRANAFLVSSRLTVVSMPPSSVALLVANNGLGDLKTPLITPAIGCAARGRSSRTATWPSHERAEPGHRRASSNVRPVATTASRVLSCTVVALRALDGFSRARRVCDQFGAGGAQRDQDQAEHRHVSPRSKFSNERPQVSHMWKSVRKCLIYSARAPQSLGSCKKGARRARGIVHGQRRV